jgi:3-hydroxybutyryl-CoA dehydrogenase
MEDIRRVGVVGCGLMGHGIAQVAAQAGYEVVVREIDRAPLDKGLAKIEKQLARAVERGKLEQADADAARARIRPTLDYGDLAGSDLVVEAITESLDSKREMWREVASVTKPEAVFATNTSSLAVIDQAVVTGRPERVLGLHFFNPPQVMRLVEVVRSVATSDEAFETGRRFAESLGKLAIPTKDKAGFIVNRLLVPLTLADFVGLDTLGAICDVLFDEFRERRFARPPTLRKMLSAGWYGRKSGRGFYDYSGDAPVAVELR